MDDQEELRRKVEAFRQHIQANTSTDPEEIERFWAKVRAEAVDQPPHRLEFLYDPESKLVLLQGNKAGLQSLLDTIARLIHPTSGAGAHAHFDSATSFTENDLDLIIQLVNDDGSDGAHIVPENRRP